MFINFRFLRDRTKKRKEHELQELTIENSNLSPGQIATAQKALQILGLEPKLEQLNRNDFVIFLYAMGLNPTDDIIDSKLRAFKLHHKKTFTFGQLAHVWHSMLQDLTDEDEILKRAFQFFDKDGNGEISVQELRTTMHELGDLLTEDEISAFMRIMDVNKDGAIGYTEFLATLKTQAPNLVDDGGGAGPGRRAAETPGGPRQCQQDSSTAAGPDGTSESPPPNVPPMPDGRLTDQGSAMASPFATAPVAPRGGLPEWASGDLAEQSSPPPPLPAASQSRGLSAMQLPDFPSRRQMSLKAGMSPPPAAPAEPLLSPNAPPPSSPPAAAPLRQSSRRLAQPLSMSPAPSGDSATVPKPSGSDRSGSGRRSEGSPCPGSAIGAGDGDPGQGLRAPSALDTASGSDGS